MRLERMSEVRKSRALNQRDLGARVGMDQSYVSKVERGMTVPTRVAEKIGGLGQRVPSAFSGGSAYRGCKTSEQVPRSLK